MPKTRVAGWFLAALSGGETEPTAGRIIEVPEDLERFEMRDARSRFIAYVPPGSVEQGRQLATTGGNGKSAPCTIFHGPELNGLGPIPGLAGRSPSYLVRQLYDFQHGTRAGPWSPLMAPNVIKLTVDENRVWGVRFCSDLGFPFDAVCAMGRVIRFVFGLRRRTDLC